MRLLPVLLIALALLPFTAAVRCFKGIQRKKIESIPMNMIYTEKCENEFCHWSIWRRKARDDKEKGIGAEITEIRRNCTMREECNGEACHAISLYGRRGVACCCTGDLCNHPDRPLPTKARTCRADSPEIPSSNFTKTWFPNDPQRPDMPAKKPANEPAKKPKNKTKPGKRPTKGTRKPKYEANPATNPTFFLSLAAVLIAAWF